MTARGRRRRPFALASALALAGLVGCGDTRGAPADARTDAVSFRSVQIRAAGLAPLIDGNTAEGLVEAARRGVRFIELDVSLSRDLRLVTAHDLVADGGCGPVSESTIEHQTTCVLASGRRRTTLEQALGAGFDEVFIDLKTGLDEPHRHLDAVRAAIAAIEAAGAKQRAVVMLYEPDSSLVRTLRQAGIRAGAKGYPANAQETRRLVDAAATLGLELVCSEARHLDVETVRHAAERGVWLLPWHVGAVSQSSHIRDLVTAGIGGLISDDLSGLRTLTSRERP